MAVTLKQIMIGSIAAGGATVNSTGSVRIYFRLNVSIAP